MNPIKSFLLPTTKISPALQQNLLQQSLWRQGDEDDQWAQRAVEHLLKKMRKEKGCLEALEQAVLQRDPNTPCVTIQRPIDGRLQVSHRKGLPHVIYCRVWRWPDLQSHHELRALPQCKHPFRAVSAGGSGSSTNGSHSSPKSSTQQQQQQHQENKSKTTTTTKDPSADAIQVVCVNPYHYERVESPVLPPVLVPRRSEFAPCMTLLPGMSQQHQQPNHRHPHHQHQFQQHQQPQRNGFINTMTAQQHQQQHANRFSTPPVMPSSYSSQLSEQQQQHHRTASRHSSNCSTSSTITGGGDNTPPPLHPNLQHRLHQSPLAGGGDNTIQPMDSDNSFAIHVPVFEEADNWCIIAYYEFNNRVGELFYARHAHVIVDGFTIPTTQNSNNNTAITTTNALVAAHNHSIIMPTTSNAPNANTLDVKIDRFSLGSVLNVGRSKQIELCRQAIGKGVHIYYVGGEVYAEVLSNSSVFVQSRLANMNNKFHAQAVCKIPPGCSIKIFSNQFFASLLREKVTAAVVVPTNSTQEQQQQQQQNVSSSSYESVFELNKLCTIRMSLVKGWGADYSRNDITATPCWVEIRLNGPLGWLDKVLSHMPPPPNLVSSRS